MYVDKTHTLVKYLGLALVTASILALQVVFTRIFSIMIWHHFTYLVIGVAMLGGGAAGTFLAVRQWKHEQLSERLGKLTLAYSVCILVNLLTISAIGIDPLRGSEIVRTLFGLAIYFVVLFTTFFFGGLVVSSVFSIWVARAHRLYFADLFGAGVSTLAVVGVVQAIGGPGAIALVAFLTMFAALLFSSLLTRGWRVAMGVIGAAQLVVLAVIVAFQPIRLPVPQSKELGWAQRQYQAFPEYTRWNPVGRVDVMPEIQIKEPMIVGGISSVYLESDEFKNLPPFDLKLVTLDGTSMTGMYRFDGTDQDLQRFNFLRHAIISAPYHLGVPHDATLKIGVGGGLDILLARLYGAKQITAIELNADVVKLLQEPYREYGGRLLDHPGTTITVAEGRSYLIRDTKQYDIIQGIGLDNLVALSGGAYVLSESYLYTTDSFRQIINRLTPQGVFAWTRNVDQPPREMLRITGLAAEALRSMGVTDPAAHIAIVQNESQTQATLLVTRSPITAAGIAELRAWAQANNFALLHDPQTRLDTAYTEYLYAPDPRAYEAAYPFNIFPVTDDNPFFYNYFKWTNLTIDSATTGKVNRFPIGNLILLTMLIFSVVTAIAFIVLPLWRSKRDGLRAYNAPPLLAYFSALGIGYIFIQIILIQRFTLFIGYPTSAITTTIFSMLIFSAIGSLIGQRFVMSLAALRVALGLIMLAIGVYILVLPSIFGALLYLPDNWRMALSVFIIAPLAVLMGIPFPTGLSRLGISAPGMVPWAWGMNGIFSVLGSVAVVIVSMASNFTTAMLFGIFFYGVAAAVATGLWQTARRSVAAPLTSENTAPAR